MALSLALIWGTSEAQSPADVAARTQLDTRFAPFYHGVASGDPLSDRVIIWTRVTPDSSSSIPVKWQVAPDTAFSTITQSGTLTTSDAEDFTVKVDVTGLQPGTWYYYRFETDGRFSVTGRTYTAPVGDVDSLRFGVVSCSRYASGFFNAYGRMAQRNDLHAVIHLGDYIYENGDSSVRAHFPDYEILNLDDYRLRHAQYKMDEDLRCLHQMYPMIPVWDDHESANNSWKDGAENHSASEGSWTDRKASAIQAYYEWMPIRQVDPNLQERIYRTISYGDLVDFFMLDTRLIGRDEQEALTGDLGDTSRYLLGPDQLGWLADEMKNSNARWKVLGQQVMMAPLEIFGFPFNTDQWDGYQAERQRVYDSILTNNIENVVVLTGDIHTFWANDLPGTNYDPNTGANSIGVEYVVTSVTTENGGFPVGGGLIQLGNPHMKYVDLDEHGYLILDLKKDRCQGDFYNISTIDVPQSYGESVGPHWYVNNGERFLQEAQAPGNPSSGVMAIQPSKDAPNPPLVSVAQPQSELAFLGLYPNPASESFTLTYYIHRPGDLQLQLVDAQGKIIFADERPREVPGLHYQTIPLDDLAAGVYLLQLVHNEQVVTRRIFKR